MADADITPTQPESRPPKAGTGSSGFRLVHGESKAAVDPLTERIMVAHSIRSMSGPLPLAGEFALYEKSLPGAGDRILTITEKEQDGRLTENQWRLRLDELLVRAHNWRAGLAQPMAWSLVVLSLYYSHDLILQGHDTAGATLGTSTIGAILAAFLKARSTSAEEKEKKKPDTTKE